MGNDEKEVDEKLYRVVRKKGSHVNTKVNPDGTKSALQFTDDNILDLASFAILSAFRDGEFIIEGKRVPIERCVNNGK